MKPLRIDHFLALKLPGHFEGFNWVSKGLQALSEESVRVHFLAQFHGISNGHLRECRFKSSSKVSVRVRFPAQAWAILNRHLRQGRIDSLRTCLLESIFLHRLRQYGTDTFDKVVLSLSSKVSVRDHFPAQAQAILNRHLRQGRIVSLLKCLLESIFLHRLGQY